jgi:hypothetical protein
VLDFEEVNDTADAEIPARRPSCPRPAGAR